jgi:hypothetical protein
MQHRRSGAKNCGKRDQLHFSVHNPLFLSALPCDVWLKMSRGSLATAQFPHSSHRPTPHKMLIGAQ